MSRGAFPFGLRAIWLCAAPAAVLFAARVAWEKTVWTWERGPQMVGFSLLHIHPILAILGALSCFIIMAWLLPSTFYALRRRRDISLVDGAMLVTSLLIAVVIMIPDTFFAKVRTNSEPTPPDLARIFAGFDYVGSYESSPLLRIPRERMSFGGNAPSRPSDGSAYVYRKASSEKFETLATSVLPTRLRDQGFAVDPASGTFEPGDGSFAIVFSRSKCHGFAFGKQKDQDEEFVLQLDVDSGCQGRK